METFENALQPGTLLGDQYRIESVLGEGGFGITYKAHDEKLDCAVAIKEYLPAELAARATDSITVQARTNRTDDYSFGIQRFMEEARTLARFRHPNIVHVNNFLEANGTAYIVMAFEEGITLNEWIKQHSKLGQQQILDIITPILEGLAEVHKTGLLHRDIKPGNIFMREHGGPMLIDFGSARHALGEHSKSISAIISQGYAPPEQYTSRGKQGPFTDLYAVGAVLYELVTGKTPIESVDRAHDIMGGEPDPLEPAIARGEGKADQWLLELIDKLLVVTANDRPQDVAEVLLALEQRSASIAEQGPVTAPAADNHTRVVSEQERFGEQPTASKESNKVSESAAPTPTPIESESVQPAPTPDKTSTAVPFFKAIGLLLVLGLIILVVMESGVLDKDELVTIKSGCYQMGSPETEKDRDDDERQHRVCVDSFKLSPYEVTVAQFKRFVSETDYRTDAEKGTADLAGCYAYDQGAEKVWGWGSWASWRWVNTAQQNQDSHPVACVSWNDANAYIDWLNEQTGKNFRLPTEAEWEYAARAGSQASRPWGDDPDKACSHANVADSTWTEAHDCNDGYTYVAPVGQFKANAFGLYDMMGNVWEWTCSEYKKDYDGSESRCTGAGAGGSRAVRGGGWINEPASVRSALRNWNGAAGRYGGIGFRLAQDL